jgi:hypothetical protein
MHLHVGAILRIMAKDEMAEGSWYRVTIPVQESKTLTGKLERIIPAEDGKQVLMFRGRTSFAVVSDEVIGWEPTKAPTTGVPKR